MIQREREKRYSSVTPSEIVKNCSSSCLLYNTAVGLLDKGPCIYEIKTEERRRCVFVIVGCIFVCVQAMPLKQVCV